MKRACHGKSLVDNQPGHRRYDGGRTDRPSEVREAWHGLLIGRVMFVVLAAVGFVVLAYVVLRYLLRQAGR